MNTSPKSTLSTGSDIEILVRVAVLGVIVMQAVQGLLTADASAAGPAPWATPVALLAYLGFAAGFWYNTADFALPRPGRLPVLLLAFQAACGFAIATDLLYIVAAEIPLVLTGRTAVLGLLAQWLALSGWISWLDALGVSLGFAALPGLPHWAEVAVTHFSIFSFQAFAFCMGWLAVSEARARHTAERVNAELRATRELLAESSRLAERSHISRELHDALGHHLVALRMSLDLAGRLSRGAAKVPLADAEALAAGLLATVREVVRDVRGTSALNLRQALATLLAGVSELRVDLEYPENLPEPGPAEAHALFRCVQEGLTNAIKHAGARRLRIVLAADAGGYRLLVADDGRGAKALTVGMGLAGMRERLENLGGSLAVDTRPGEGLSLRIELPCAERPR